MRLTASAWSTKRTGMSSTSGLPDFLIARENVQHVGGRSGLATEPHATSTNWHAACRWFIRSERIAMRSLNG